MTMILLALLLNAYEAQVVRVVDGDTVDVRIAVWLDLHQTARIRIRGLDTPELKGKCENERGLARMARAFAMLNIGQKVFVTAVDYDKFGGRYNADIRLASGKLLSELLIENHLARRYGGGKRQSWC